MRPARFAHLGNGRFTVKNHLDFTDLADFLTVEYEFTTDGVSVKKGTVDMPSVAPHKTVEFELSAILPEGHSFVTFNLYQKEDAPWAKAGYLLGFDQIELTAFEPKKTVLCSGTVQVQQDDDTVVLTGDGFVYTYSKRTGTFTQMERAGESLFVKPMEYNIWRAPTDNDRKVKGLWQKYGYERTIFRPYETDVAVDENGVFAPDADMLVKFSVDGGEVIGVGNGDPNSHEDDKANERHFFNGCAQAIVMQHDGADKVIVKAESDGLTSAEVTLNTVKGHEKTYLESVSEVYINNWRTNMEVFSDKPAHDIVIEDSDMNSWVIEEPGYSDKYMGRVGYGIYKTKAEIPQDAKKILFREVTGDDVEIYINNVLVWKGDAHWGKMLEFTEIGTGNVELTVIIRTDKNDDGAGITKPVVFVG